MQMDSTAPPNEPSFDWLSKEPNLSVTATDVLTLFSQAAN